MKAAPAPLHDLAAWAEPESSEDVKGFLEAWGGGRSYLTPYLTPVLHFLTSAEAAVAYL